jgi:hypothetical protein
MIAQIGLFPQLEWASTLCNDGGGAAWWWLSFAQLNGELTVAAILAPLTPSSSTKITLLFISYASTQEPGSIIKGL